MKQKKNTPSAETQFDAQKIAKATQKPGQTKEQTKLIAQGIEKGIALYKKQQKERQREAEEAKKKAQRSKQQTDSAEEHQPVEPTTTEKSSNLLPWILLIVSWIGFIAYVMGNQYV